jgi:hypothetical protein
LVPELVEGREFSYRSAEAKSYLNLPDGYLKVPDGYLKVPDGYLNLPDGYLKLPDVYLKVPDGYLNLPDVYLKVPDVYLKVPDVYLKVPDGYLKTTVLYLKTVVLYFSFLYSIFKMQPCYLFILWAGGAVERFDVGFGVGGKIDEASDGVVEGFVAEGAGFVELEVGGDHLGVGRFENGKECL